MTSSRSGWAINRTRLGGGSGMAAGTELLRMAAAAMLTGMGVLVLHSSHLGVGAHSRRPSSLTPSPERKSEFGRKNWTYSAQQVPASSPWSWQDPRELMASQPCLGHCI